MKKVVLFCFIIVGISASAQQEYTTPNTGVNWTLQDIISAQPDVVQFINNKYQISKSITVAENDTLRFIAGDFIEVDKDLLLTVKGTLISHATASDSIVVTAKNITQPFKGFRLENGSNTSIKYTQIIYGGGIKAISPLFSITNSKLAFNKKGVATTGTIELSHGSPLIAENLIEQNDMPAISSPANFDVSAQILNNLIKENNLKNENKPQINMGTTGTDTLKIIGNTIIGNREMKKVGGIAISNLLNAGRINVIIDGNNVRDNRYGIAILGSDIEAQISNNLIEDNTSQNLPNSGGEGIALEMGDTTQNTTIFGNQIRRNLWGITVLNGGTLNMGDNTENFGNNTFSENGNGGQIYALVNKTSNTILAKNNCWIEGHQSTLEEVATIILDQADNTSYGEVIYDPINPDCAMLSIENEVPKTLKIYPNPTSDYFFIDGLMSIELKSLKVVNMNGQETQLLINKGKVDISSLPVGIYIIQAQMGDKTITTKLFKK